MIFADTADVKVNVKEQEIKKLVALSYNFIRSTFKT